jgi:hypothetical protein
MLKKYNDKHIEFLKDITPGRYNNEITKLFNEKFNMNVTEVAIKTLRAKHKIKSNVPTRKIIYTEEQLNYLRKLCKEGLFNKEITERFNNKFNLNKTESAIDNIRAKYGIKTTARLYFNKGHVPWNKGLHYKAGGRSKETQFKKGEMPPNWVPIGSERITKDGYIQIKIQEGKFQRNWRGKHILIWEEINGPLPDGHAIIFGDGDKRNFDIDNLILVTRAELLILNRKSLIKNDAEITKTGVNIARLYQKISERNR